MFDSVHHIDSETKHKNNGEYQVVLHGGMDMIGNQIQTHILLHDSARGENGDTWIHRIAYNFD